MPARTQSCASVSRGENREREVRKGSVPRHRDADASRLENAQTPNGRDQASTRQAHRGLVYGPVRLQPEVRGHQNHAAMPEGARQGKLLPVPAVRPAEGSLCQRGQDLRDQPLAEAGRGDGPALISAILPLRCARPLWRAGPLARPVRRWRVRRWRARPRPFADPAGKFAPAVPSIAGRPERQAAGT